ncbi:hypothetical protein PHLCEN_2v8022 [Hermanssonia centrifuga]|uniref:ENTH domain-containing protein n=1 Tax=Hermanssonia centrifuga TaxID=98765 RepID=A0A2R6NV18_9APHY|nr:hypothetical protein PHLCEN_2v8022 [Hermanssonia centrifuga]
MEYLLLYGSSDVIKYCLNNLYEFKTLREFQYIDDNGIDQGHNVRQIAKAITNMLLSPSTIRSKRHGRKSYDDLDTDRSRGGCPTGSVRSTSFDGDDSRREVVPRKRAVTESDAMTSEDRDLLRAIELSKAEEEKRRKAVVAASSTVFNDFEQAKRDDPLIDLSDIQMPPPAPLQLQYTQLQPQYTVQPQFAVQPQYTSLPPQFTSLQPQYTPFQPQFTQGSMYDLQMQQEAMQAMYLRQQAEWSAAQAQAQAAAQQEEMSRQQQMLQYQHTQVPPVHSPPPHKPLAPQPTSFGSNNPFAAPSPSPSLSSGSSTSPSNASFTAPSTPYSARSLSRNAADERYAQLAHAYAGRAGDDSGVDTFAAE